MMLAEMSVICGGVPTGIRSFTFGFLESRGDSIALLPDRMDGIFDDQGVNDSEPKTRPYELILPIAGFRSSRPTEALPCWQTIAGRTRSCRRPITHTRGGFSRVAADPEAGEPVKTD